MLPDIFIKLKIKIFQISWDNSNKIIERIVQHCKWKYCLKYIFAVIRKKTWRWCIAVFNYDLVCSHNMYERQLLTSYFRSNWVICSMWVEIWEKGSSQLFSVYQSRICLITFVKNGPCASYGLHTIVLISVLVMCSSEMHSFMIYIVFLQNSQICIYPLLKSVSCQYVGNSEHLIPSGADYEFPERFYIAQPSELCSALIIYNQIAKSTWFIHWFIIPHLYWRQAKLWWLF